MALKNVKPIPDGMRSITPHLVCKNALEAIEFYKRAFGATENIRLLGPHGALIHASLKIGDSNIMLAEENLTWGSLSPITLKGTPITIHLQVEDVDTMTAQAVAAGATVKMPVADMFWGDRYGMIEDPFGHRWALATRICDLTAAEMQEAATRAFYAQNS